MTIIHGNKLLLLWQIKRQLPITYILYQALLFSNYNPQLLPTPESRPIESKQIKIWTSMLILKFHLFPVSPLSSPSLPVVNSCLPSNTAHQHCPKTHHAVRSISVTAILMLPTNFCRNDGMKWQKHFQQPKMLLFPISTNIDSC